MNAYLKKIFGHWTMAALAVLTLLAMPLSAGADTIKVMDLDGSWVKYKYNGSWHDHTAGEFSTQLNSGGDVWDSAGYCVDLDQGIGNYNSPWNVDLLAVSQDLGWMDAAWLMDTFAVGVVGDNYLPPGTWDPTYYNKDRARAALQLTIWEVVFDISEHNLYSGSFRISSYSNDYGIKALADAYLKALVNQGGNLTTTSTYAVAYSEVKQDLLVQVSNNGVSSTPEPGSMLLFGSAAGVMGWWRRRKAKAEEA